jgi:hypothetical protein
MSYDADDMHTGWSEAANRALRDLYAPPSVPGYWESLEARIMARIDEEGAPWWTAFGRWTRVGAVAATIAIVVSGMATTAITHEAEARIASEAVIAGGMVPVSAYDRAVLTPGMSTVDASFQYVFPY